MKAKLLLISIFVLIQFHSPYAKGQGNDSTSQNFFQKNFSITGEIGAYGELYSIEGQPKRRPSSTGRIFFRPTINLFGIFQIPFEFLLSTEGSAARQNINQFGINPKWGWGSLQAGDFTEEYSQFTLSGIKIRGGGLSLTPGKFRFSTAVGFTQRFVSGGAQDGSFKRFLFAAKLGYGSEESSFIDFIFLRARDENNPAPSNQKSITIISPNGNDVFEIGTLQVIRWISNGVDDAVKIELSRDGGATFELIADNQPNVGFYNWTVTGAPTFQAIVKVSSQNYPEIFDVSDFVFTIGTNVQSMVAANSCEIINYYSITPQENLLLGTRGKISFLENIISLEFEGAGSVYTRDIRASELNLDSTGFPSFLAQFFKPRVGTNYDFAVNTSLNLNFPSFNTKVGFKNIGPGYQSLGTAFLLNDIREYSLMNSIRIGTVGVLLSYLYQNDNLLHQKLFTTSRNIITLGMNAMITSFWNTSLSANYLKMKNDSNNDSTKTDFGSLVISTNQSLSISQQGFFRNININYAFQNSINNSYLIQNAKTTVHTLNLSAMVYPMNNLSATLSAGIVSSNAFDTLKTNTQNYSFQIQHTAFSNKLITTLNLTTSFSENNTSFRTTFSSGYRLTNTDNIGLVLSYMKYNGNSQSGGNFKEFIGSLNYTHTFNLFKGK